MVRGQILELRVGASEDGYFLNGTLVFPGQDLEILLEGKVWLLGRFERSGARNAPPMLHVACGGAWEDTDDPETSTFPIPPEIKFAISREALLRRPLGLDPTRRRPTEQ